jgi:hypothetical protein
MRQSIIAAPSPARCVHKYIHRYIHTYWRLGDRNDTGMYETKRNVESYVRSLAFTTVIDRFFSRYDTTVSARNFLVAGYMFYVA